MFGIFESVARLNKRITELETQMAIMIKLFEAVGGTKRINDCCQKEQPCKEPSYKNGDRGNDRKRCTWTDLEVSTLGKFYREFIEYSATRMGRSKFAIECQIRKSPERYPYN